MPTGSGAWSQKNPRPPVQQAAAGYGGAGYNAFSGGNGAGLLSNGQAYTPAPVGREPPRRPPIFHKPNNFGPANGPDGNGAGGYGGGGGYFDGDDPF
ncbi:hypothetical protein ONS96_013093 [Cadophora gregata f. sp. sojae]|nr:hypothetical protein ONS96_013093 [Cadophora gregata f. sp. sojae]